MSELKVAGRPSSISPTTIVVALLFGLAAFVVVFAGLTVPMPGTRVVTDPRELFTTIGAALTGPMGGILIGILAGAGEPVEVRPSILAHVAGGLWMGFAYKRLAYAHFRMPALLLAWAIMVLMYYFVLVIPGFVVGQALFSAAPAAESPWQMAVLWDAYDKLWQGALLEVVLTTAITTLALAALPRRYRLPLW